MEARSIVAPVEPGPEVGTAAAVPAAAEQTEVPAVAIDARAPSGAGPRRTRPRAATRVVPLPREVEYAYIRSDMRRLLAIAAILLILMLVAFVAVGF